MDGCRVLYILDDIAVYDKSVSGASASYPALKSGSTGAPVPESDLQCDG